MGLKILWILTEMRKKKKDVIKKNISPVKSYGVSGWISLLQYVDYVSLASWLLEIWLDLA